MSMVQKNVRIGKVDAQYFTLTNSNNIVVELTNWGATLVDVQTPDKHGVVQSITLAHASIDAYAQNAPYFGSTVGRSAGRIAHGAYRLDGVAHQLPPEQLNQNSHHLHGGVSAMSHQLWRVVDATDEGVELEYVSVAGENAYPANLTVRAVYTLNNDGLTIQYTARADAPTLCNLTNHAYFNLSGNAARTVHTHVLQVAADAVCAMDEDLLVTDGEWAVADSDFDFREPRELKQALNSTDVRLTLARGIDHYFVLNDFNGNCVSEKPQVILSDATSGRRLQMFTDQPCVVLYAHNYADGEPLRHEGVGQMHDALCIETQKLPHQKPANGDHPAALYPNETYAHTTRFVFDVLV